MNIANRLGELSELFGPPETIVKCRCVPHDKARALARLQVVRAVNDIRTLNDAAWLDALPYIRALLLGM